MPYHIPDNKSHYGFPYYFFATLILLQGFHCLEYVHSITLSEPLFVNQTLVSSGQVFELGFFRPNGSENLYVGIWYKDRPQIKPTWVANRKKLLESMDQSAGLTIGSDGNLKLLDGQQNIGWSTNASVGSKDSVAELLDNGNFVLTHGNFGDKTWEIFNYPSDILLPVMKVRAERFFVSWKSDNDPLPGSFSGGISLETPPQAFIWNGSGPYFRGGQWDKSKFIGVPDSGYSLETSYFSLNADNGSDSGFFFVLPEDSFKIMKWD